jgi:protein-S-isoprenylcysteine O-methyltransferase Ste14
MEQVLAMEFTTAIAMKTTPEKIMKGVMQAFTVRLLCSCTTSCEAILIETFKSYSFMDLRGVVTIPKNRHGLGAEHPLCDKIQAVMVFLFFVVWGTDTLSLFIFNHSTVVAGLFSYPLLIIPALFFICFGLYLITKSHKAIFGELTDRPVLITEGVYSRVRHPMYLGILLLCLGFCFLSLSLLALGILIVFFIFYDRMAAYEEKDLERLFGEAYRTYQNHVPKWLVRLW